ADALPEPSTRPLRPAYRATFDRDVRIHQADQQLVQAEQMFIDFVFASQEPDAPADQPATQPATRPAEAVAARAIVAAEQTPSTKPGASDTDTDTATDTDAVADAGAPQPVIVY